MTEFSRLDLSLIDARRLRDFYKAVSRNEDEKDLIEALYIINHCVQRRISQGIMKPRSISETSYKESKTICNIEKLLNKYYEKCKEIKNEK